VATVPQVGPTIHAGLLYDLCPMRVIALTPAAAEIMNAIGATDLLVGRSHEDGFPSGLAHLPVVSSAIIPSASPAEISAAVDLAIGTSGSLYTLDIDRIRELRPTLLITQDLCSVCSADLSAVQQLCKELTPTPAICSLNPRSIEDVFDTVVEVGQACGYAENAARTMVALRARFCDARDHVNPYVDGPRTAVIEWTDPLHLAGLWTPGMIAAAGGLPIGPRSGEASHAIDPSILIEAKPERIIVAPCGVGLGNIEPHLDALRATDWWHALPAVQNGHVQVLDGTSSFSRPGPRLIDVFEWLVPWLSDPQASSDLQTVAAGPS